MRKQAIFCLLIFCIFLSGCAVAETTYTVTKNNKIYTVDTENHTISDSENTYFYTFSGDSSIYRVQITYPDGSTYERKTTESGGIRFASASYNDDYDPKKYVTGEILCEILETKAPKKHSPEKAFFVIFLLAVGIFNLAAPETSWQLSHGWRYKNAEPSDLALTANRLSGVAAILLALVLPFLL